MSVFEGNLFNIKHQYHSYVSDSKALEALGIPVYSHSSLTNFFNEFPFADLQEFFDNQSLTTKDKLLGKNNSSIEILRFDEETRSYVSQTGSNIFKTSDDSSTVVSSNLEDFLTAVDDYYASFDKDSATNKNIKDAIYKIQNSYSGCITFKAPAISILGATGDIFIKLYINDTQNIEKRTMAINGSPLISSPPSTPVGTVYGIEDSNNLSIGSYAAPSSKENNNPKNAVAAQLSLTYNNALGKWESGTQQVMCRILEDIDSPELTENLPTNVDAIPTYEFYDANSPSYLGSFTKGKALTLNNEKGNPHMFGPNNIDGCEDKKKETIIAINRLPYSYKQDDIVVCSRLGNEWTIITPGRPATRNSTLKIKKWSFNKIVANADSFRDLDNGGDIISYDTYERFMRIIFYHSQQMSDNLTTINIYSKDQQDDKPYNYFDDSDIEPAEASDYDVPSFRLGRVVTNHNFVQVGSHMGGFDSKTTIGRTSVNNALLDPPIEAGNLFQYEIPNFWGCVFPQGYAASSRAKLGAINSIKKSKYNFTTLIDSGNGYIRNVDLSNPVYINSNSYGAGTNILDISDTRNVPAANVRLFAKTPLVLRSPDTNLFQLPAEIGTNGSLLDTYGFPNETIGIFMTNRNDNQSSFAEDVHNNYLYNSDRYDWYSQTGVNNPSVYALKPVNANQIQFSPLQLEYATYAYWDRDNSSMGSDDKNILLNLASSLSQDIGVRRILKFASDTEYDAPGPVGGPGLFPTNQPGEKSNVMGIIAAVQTFSSKDAISFTTENSFGLPQRKNVSGGSSASLSFLPAMGGGLVFGFGPTAGSTNAFPQWGSLEFDNYYSFGTTALHVRVFDAWPKEQTIYDPQLYGILHFNPGKYSDDPIIKTVPSRFDEDFQVHAISTPVDFRVPTASGTYSNIAVDTVIGTGYRIWPESEWRVDPVRRGQLLTGGGFRYWRKYIGVNNFQIIKAEPDAEPGTKFQLDNGVEIEIVTQNSTGNSAIKILNKGKGFKPSDFATKHIIEDVEYFGRLMGFGNGGRILFTDGIVYKTIEYDPGPKEHTDGPVRLTPSSNRGKGTGNNQDGYVAKTQTTSVALGSNPTRSYDAFYYFHNDILHTPIGSYASIPGNAQYVILTVE